MSREVVGQVKFDGAQALAEIQKLNNSLSQLQSQSEKAFSDIQASINKGFEKVESGIIEGRLQALGRTLTDLGKSGFDALSRFSQPSLEFADQMANLNTIARLSGDEQAKFTESVRTTGQRLGLAVDPAKAAAGAYEVLSASSTSASKALSVADQAIRLGVAGRAEFAQSSDLLTTVLNSYGISADQAALTTDKLLKTVEIGKTKVPELAQSFGLVASIASQSGVSFDQLTASIAVATQNGVKTSTAMEGLRSAINNLTKPSKEAEEVFQRLGIRVDGATLKSEGFFATLDKIAKATKGNTIDLATIFSDASGRATALTLIDNNGLKDATKRAEASIRGAAGTTDAFIAEQKKSPLEARKELDAAYSAFSAGATQTFIPVLTKMLNIGTEIIGMLDKVPGPVKMAGLVFAGWASAALVATGSLIGVAAALPALTTGIPLLASSIAGAAGALGASLTPALVAVGGAASTAAVAITPLLPLLGALAVTVGLAVWSEHAKHMAEIATAYAGAGVELANLGDKAAGKKGSGGSLGQLLSQDAKQLRDSGVNLEQFAIQVRKLQTDIDDAKENGTPFAKLQRDLNALLAKRREFTELLYPTPPAGAAPAIPLSESQIKEQQKAAEKKREEDFKQRVFEIENSRQTAVQKIKAFRDVLDQYAKEPEEKRQIQRNIFQLENRATEYQLEQAKKRRQDALANQLQEIELSKAPADAKIKALEAIRTKFNLNASEERSLTEKIAEQHKKADDERIKRLEKISGLQATAADLERQKSDQNLSKLQQDQQRGTDTTDAQLQELQKRRAAQVKEDQARLAKDLAGTTDPAAQALLKANEKKREQLSADELANRTRELQRQQAQQRAQDSVDEKTTAKSVADARIQQLQSELQTGKDVGSQLKQAILDRVKLQEQEIALRLAAEKLATDNPAKIKQAETRAELELLEARKKGKAEIEATTQAIEKQKQASKPTVGGIQSLEEFVAEQNKRFGSDVTDRINQIKSQSAGAANTPLELSTTELEQRLRQQRTGQDPFGPLAGQQPVRAGLTAGARAAAESTSNVTLKAELKLLDPTGRERQYEISNQEVTVDGRGSSISIKAARLSKSTMGV